MPQMSPLQWEMLFIFCLLAAISVSCKIFFTSMNETNTENTDKNNSSANLFIPWLW